jgi:hypothetical protein
MLDHDFLSDLFNELALKVGAESDFIKQLNKDNDWNFVIKICIFTEELCLNAIMKKIGNDNILDFISRLQLVGGQTGKLPLLKQLALIGKDEENYITGIAEIRNKYAHRIKYAQVDLPGYIDRLSGEQKVQLQQKFNAGIRTIDKTWGGNPKDSKYWRLVIEVCFVLTAHKLAKESGLLKEAIESLAGKMSYLDSIMPRA